MHRKEVGRQFGRPTSAEMGVDTVRQTDDGPFLVRTDCHTARGRRWDLRRVLRGGGSPPLNTTSGIPAPANQVLHRFSCRRSEEHNFCRFRGEGKTACRKPHRRASFDVSYDAFDTRTYLHSGSVASSTFNLVVAVGAAPFCSSSTPSCGSFCDSAGALVTVNCPPTPTYTFPFSCEHHLVRQTDQGQARRMQYK